MSKSMVEKYEQLLSQDPTSTVFVELARAYLDKGENEKAIELCRQGCSHHPASVVGRVLWGKGLINSGKAAEAMQQFDAAANIDRDNPHAYNLISEVLLRKGLYRSALPILRKAAALQPDDARIKQWLEQARAALAGGPAPVLTDDRPAEAAVTEEPRTQPTAVAAVEEPKTQPTALVQPAPKPSGPRAARASGPRPAAPQEPSADPDVFAAFAPAAPDPRAEPTVLMSAYEGQSARVTAELQIDPPPGAWPSAPRSLSDRPAPPVPTTELPAVIVASSLEDGRPTMELPVANVSVGPVRPSQQDLPMVVGSLEDRTATAELPAMQDAPDPFAALTARTETSETFRGLTSTFQALEQAEAAPLPVSLPSSSEPSVQTVFPSVEVPLVTQAAAGLLDDVVSAQSEVPTSDFPMPGMRPAAAPRPAAAAAGGGGLLDEIPDSPFESAPIVEGPRVEFSTQATEAIAREYERELREKLQAKQQEKTFLQKHGLKLGLGVTALVVALALAGSFVVTRQRHGGENLESALAKGRVAINSDTKEQYLLGLTAFEQALAMDESNTDAWANIAYARAVLYAEHGGALDQREAARAALDKPKVREAHPDIALVVDYLTADAAELAGRRQQLLGSELNQSLVEAQAGRVLLSEKKLDDAFKHLQKATELNGRNLRALVGLGEYYLASEDFENAARILATAETLSKYHPQRVMGLAEARLEQGREANEALSELEGLPQSAAVPAALQARYTLLLGRSQSAAGRHDEANKTLTAGLAEHKALAFDFQMALAMAGRNAGRMIEAQKGYEEAIRLNPKSEAAKEGLGRVLLARSREREVLERLKPEADQRRVALVRGIAATRLDDPRKARLEFDRTRINGKYPEEAVVYLALNDAAEEGGEKAIATLEKRIALSKRHKSAAQIALARVFMKRNELTKARAQLEEAAKDPQDYEANALLGQLYLEAVDMGVPAETALAPLQRAVERNGSHGPSRHLLTRTYLALGQLPEATKQIEAWTADNPGSDEAWVDAAFVFVHTGRFKEAEAAIAKGVKPDSTDVGAFRVKALVLFARGDARNGFAALERANKLNPKDAETFCDIGNAFVRQGNVDTALKAFEAARRENPKALCGLVGPHHARPTSRGGRPTPKEELLALQKQAFTFWDKALVDACLARVLLEERDLKRAAELAENATRLAPFSAPAWFALAEVARKQKNEARALEGWTKAAEYDASWSQARLAHADALLRTGGEGPRQALAEYEAVLGLSQNEAELSRVKKVIATLKKQLK